MREGVFVAEGVRWLRDVVARGIAPVMVFAVDLTALPPLTCPVFQINAALMRQISDVETPSGILLVLPQITVPLPSKPTLLLLLDAVQTPGNLGTMLRTAAAAGVDAVLLAPGCVDVYNPKVVRGAMGAHLHLPLQRMEWGEIENYVAGLQVVVASAESSQHYTDYNWQQPTVLIIGNEANGPSATARALGKGIAIPMANQTESLNAAMAAGILLFEAVRQRR